MKKNVKKLKRERRHRRIRSKIKGTKSVPRLAVFKSNTHMYVQLIDDENMKTLLGTSSVKISGKTLKEKAAAVGKEIAKQAGEKGIKRVVFDRGGFVYTGNIKALADSAREGGLKF